MQRHREKSPAGTIAITAIITLILLGGLTYLVGFFGLPSIPISAEALHTVLLRLLPIIIGLILVLIALAIRPPRIPKDIDGADDLERDSFTAPLFNLPNEEEQPVYGRTQLPVPEAQVTSSVSASPSEVQLDTGNRVPNVAPQITPFLGVPVRHEEPKPDIPAESAYRRSFSVETPVESPVQEPMPSAGLGRAVLFSEYPFAIEPDSDIAQLLEPIGETLLSGELGVEYLEEIEDTFETRLDSELASALDLGYDLSLAVIDVPHADSDTHSVDATVVQDLFNRLGIVTFFYLTEAHRVSAILPFHGFEQSRRYFASLLENLRKHHANSTVTVGFSCLKGRELSASSLIEEATIAADLALERGGYSLIGYDTDLEPTEEI